MQTLKDPSLLHDRCLINGQWVDAVQKIEVINPSTGKLIGTVPSFDEDATRQAIDAANAAWPAWRDRTAQERSAVLRRWHDLIVENKSDLARIMTAEQGKPLAEAESEIVYAASFIQWFSEEAKRVYGETIPSPHRAQRIVVQREPIGICAAITPWNFPAAMITRKAGPALAAGCVMVVKPASQTPLTALALADLALRAGMPAGVLSVVTGSARRIGTELATNALIRKLTFTGSTQVGRTLLSQAAATIKKTSMELGGNAPFIVFEDADLDAAVEGAILSKFRNAGQTCVCANRLYVHDKIYDQFSQRLADRLKTMKVGPGDEPGVVFGPLINGAAVEKVEEHIADAVARGATVLAGGKRHQLGGSFFEPTVLLNVTQEMQVAREETFGPMAPLFRFKGEADVVAMANDTEFGLASYLYTRDLARAWRVAEQLECGMVGVNTGLISNEVAPFGGVKQSGLGREGSHLGMDEYLVIKYINFAGIA